MGLSRMLSLGLICSAFLLAQYPAGIPPVKWGMPYGQVAKMLGKGTQRVGSSRLEKAGVNFGGEDFTAVYFFAGVADAPMATKEGGLSQISLRRVNQSGFVSAFKTIERELTVLLGQQPTSWWTDKFRALTIWESADKLVSLNLLDPTQVSESLTSSCGVLFQARQPNDVQHMTEGLMRADGPLYPDRRFSLVKPILADDMRVVNDGTGVAIQFKIESREIAFELSNNRQTAIEIDWDRCAIIGLDSTSRRIAHAGVHYGDVGKPQAKSLVPPGALLREALFPIDNLYYSKTDAALGFDGWSFKPLLPQSPGEWIGSCGKTFGAFIMLRIDGQDQGETFQFRIDCER